MAPVFNRNPGRHRYDDALAAWVHSLEEERAMALNLMHDHRVSVEREKAFDGFVSGPPTADDLQQAIKKYFENAVRTRKLPHYVYTTLNANNLLVGNDPLSLTMSRDVRLVRVLDLNGLTKIYQWARRRKNRRREWVKSLMDFPRRPTDPDMVKWLDDKFGGRSKDEIQEMIAAVLDMVNAYRLQQPFQPTWAAIWSEFEPHERQGPNRWLQVLGMVKPPPRWLILLGYSVREAGTLARPTTLDAGWYGYHFPSPPQAPPESGGHPMDLRVSPRATYLLREYIHKQIHHSLKHWTDLGGKIGRTTAPNRESLTAQREAHHELLADTYGPDVRAWMDKPI